MDQKDLDAIVAAAAATRTEIRYQSCANCPKQLPYTVTLDADGTVIHEGPPGGCHCYNSPSRPA